MADDFAAYDLIGLPIYVMQIGDAARPTQVVYCNGAFRRLVVIGDADSAMLATERMTPETIAELRVRYRQAMTSGKHHITSTLRVAFKDGREAQARLVVTPFQRDDITHILVAVVDLSDIAAERQSEEAERRVLTAAVTAAESRLSERERMWRSIVDTLPLWISLVGVDERYILVNKLAGEMLGLDPAEVAGRPLTDFVPPEALDQLRDWNHRVLEGEQFPLQDYPYPLVPGVPGRYMAAKTRLPDGRGGAIGVLSYYLDATENHRLRDERERIETTFRELFNAAPIGIARAREDGTILEANDAYLAISGVARPDLGRTTFWDITPPEHWDNERACIAKFNDTGEVIPIVKQYRHADGRLVDVVVTPVNAKLPGEDNTNWVFVQDVTPLKNTERQLRRHEVDLIRAVKRAEEANLTKSRFLANMSHELRTPLNAVIGFSEVMSNELLGPIGTPRYLTYSADILASAKHLLSIINDIIDLARIEAGRYEIVTAEFDPSRTVHDSLAMVGPQIETKRISLVVHSNLDKCRFVADERAFRQILINLLSNAIKFSDEGGTVVVTVELDHRDDLRLTVTDHGVGIEPSRIKRLFEPFQSADPGLARIHGGSGLGLSICKNLVDLHRGTIDIDSTPGERTTVTVWLPKVSR